MTVLAKYVKQPSDRKRYQIRYDNWLDSGELVSDVTFSSPSVDLVVDGVQVTADGLGVQYYVSGGVDGQNYTVTATLTTNNGPQIREDEIFFSIREA